MGKSNRNKKGPILDRNGVYHYRRRIPDDVRRILRQLDSTPDSLGRKQDKREEKKRLGRDFVRAQAAWDEHNRHVEAKWDQLRQGVVRGLTMVQQQAIAGDIYRRWLKRLPPEYLHTYAIAMNDLALMQELDHAIC
jgi:hypothetical protein